MAGTGNVGVIEDEENVYTGTRVRPFAITPRVEQRRVEEEKKQNPTTMKKIFALEDLFSLEVWRASLAELLGTAVLVFVMDTIVISSYETETKTPHLIMAFLIAVTITILLLATFPVSGGHINPVISLAAAFTGLVSLPRATVYILAQCVGGILGALALQAVVNSKTEQTFSLGGCTLTIVVPSANGPLEIGLKTSQGLWLEIICTFVFLFASIWMAFDKRQAKHLGRVVVCSIIGIVVGLIVFISTTVTSTKGYAGVGMNPARCLGPALIRGGHLWSGHWVFWAGPAIACMAFALYTKVIPSALALKAVVNSSIERTYSLAGCTVTIVAQGQNGPTETGLGTRQALWLEIICSFVFLFASVWMAFDPRQAKAVGRVTVCVILGIVLGLLVYISTTVTATKGYGGAGLNPARCLGPAVVRGGHLWNGHWIFWVGPAIGCAAFALYVKMIPSEHTHSY